MPIYACELPSQAVEAQLAQARAYCMTQGIEGGEEVHDRDPSAWRRPLHLRPAGEGLLGRLGRGAALVVAGPLVLGPRAADFLRLGRRLERLGVALHIAGCNGQGPFSTATAGWRPLLDLRSEEHTSEL